MKMYVTVMLFMTLFIGLSVQQCTSTQYETTVDGTTTCVDCVAPCMGCSDATTCTSCVSSKFTFNSTDGSKFISKFIFI